MITGPNELSRLNKKPIATIKITSLANKAAPSPLLGQALGQYGTNIMESRKNFNNQTRNSKEHVYVPTTVHLYSRENFKVTIKTPSTAYLIKQVANIPKGGNMPKKQQEGFINLKEIYHLAIFKKCDKILNHLNMRSLCRSITGTAKSMGITTL
jgi:large subunit ribosomal protein L11